MVDRFAPSGPEYVAEFGEFSITRGFARDSITGSKGGYKGRVQVLSKIIKIAINAFILVVH